MLNCFKGDLHIHSVLSPCTDLDMGPRNIIEKCLEKEIKIISITDHNCGANVPAFMNYAANKDIMVIPGIEVQTREEVHYLCYFPNYIAMRDFQENLQSSLPNIQNHEEIFGMQLVVDEYEQIIDKWRKLLINSSNWSTQKLCEEVNQQNGLVVPAHVDKKNFSLLSNLGPPGDNSKFSAIEIFAYEDKTSITSNYTDLGHYTWIVSSDAHSISELDSKYKSYFYMKELSWYELKQAFCNLNSRRVVISKN